MTCHDPYARLVAAMTAVRLGMPLDRAYAALAKDYAGDISRAVLIARNASAHSPIRLNRVHLAKVRHLPSGQWFTVYTPKPQGLDVMPSR